MKYDDSVKEKALELRKEGKSLRSISKTLKISQATASLWLRKHPLKDLKARMAHGRGGSGKKPRGVDSKFWKAVNGDMTSVRKYRISEAAVLFRLALHGIEMYSSPFDGDRVDWVVVGPGGIFHKLQVRSVKRSPSSHGLPIIPIHCYEGRTRTRTYAQAECDFVVGYDLKTDVAYVFSYPEISTRKRSVTVTPDAAERWDKIQ